MITRIVTDTSTIAVFDLEVLRYLVQEDGDWWTYKSSGVLQRAIENHEVLLIDTGLDGRITVSINNVVGLQAENIVKSVSGNLCIVCGEELPGDNLLPEMIRGGTRLSVGKGNIGIAFTVESDRVCISWDNRG